MVDIISFQFCSRFMSRSSKPNAGIHFLPICISILIMLGVAMFLPCLRIGFWKAWLPATSLSIGSALVSLGGRRALLGSWGQRRGCCKRAARYTCCLWNASWSSCWFSCLKINFFFRLRHRGMIPELFPSHCSVLTCNNGSFFVFCFAGLWKLDFWHLSARLSGDSS